MNIPDYAFFEHPTEFKNTIMILQTFKPYLIGQVWLFHKEDDYNSFIARRTKKKEVFVLLPGYQIAVTMFSSLEHLDFDHTDNLGILEEMINFYNEQRIKKNAARYKRYQISTANP